MRNLGIKFTEIGNGRVDYIKSYGEGITTKIEEVEPMNKTQADIESQPEQWNTNRFIVEVIHIPPREPVGNGG